MFKMDQTPFDSLDDGIDLLGLGVGRHFLAPVSAAQEK
jgi:hypothetical protein